MKEITDSEWLDIQGKALEFTKQNISDDNWELIYNLQRENLKKDLIISKFKV